MAVPYSEPVPFNTRRPFSRAQARAAGIRHRELLSPRFHKVLYDRHVAAAVPITTLLRAETVLQLSPPGSYISHFTAAELWGAVVPDVSEVHVTVPGEAGRSRRQGVRSHKGAGEPQPVGHRGIPISSPVQTFLDLAAIGLDLVELVVLGDSLVKACRVSPDQLVEAAKDWAGPGAQRARKAARLVRDGVDSPAETRLRLLLVFAGLPEPLVNMIIRAADGSWHLRFDLCYEKYRLIVEYDGRQHAENAGQWQRDLARREELDAMGWRLIVITAQDLYTRPERVLVRVRDALIDRGATGVRSQFKSEWRRHFADH